MYNKKYLPRVLPRIFVIINFLTSSIMTLELEEEIKVLLQAIRVNKYETIIFVLPPIIVTSDNVSGRQYEIKKMKSGVKLEDELAGIKSELYTGNTLRFSIEDNVESDDSKPCEQQKSPKTMRKFSINESVPKFTLDGINKILDITSSSHTNVISTHKTTSGSFAERVMSHPSIAEFIKSLLQILHNNRYVTVIQTIDGVNATSLIRRRDDIVLLLLENTDQLMESSVVSLKCSFSHRVRHLVVLPTQAAPDGIKSVLNILWRANIRTAAVAVPLKNSWKVITWRHPFRKHSKCDTIPSFIQEIRLPLSSNAQKDIYPSKSIGNLQGCTVVVAPVIWAPYIMNQTKVSSEGELLFIEGLDIRILNTLEAKLNFNTEFVYWDGMSWPEAVALLVDGRGDLTLGAYLLEEQYLSSLDTSISYWLEEIKWFVPAPGFYPRWKSFTMVFHPELWLWVVLSFLSVGAVIWVLDMKRQRASSSMGHDSMTKCCEGQTNLCSIYLLVLVHLLGSSMRFSSLRRSGKYLLILWAAACLVLYSGYQSALFSLLAAPLHAPLVDSVDAILRTRWSLGLHPFWQEYLNVSGDDRYREVSRRSEACGEPLLCLQRAARRRDMAVAIDASFVAFNLEPRDATALHALPDAVSTQHLAAYARRAAPQPLAAALDFVINALKEGGLLALWWRQLTERRRVPGSIAHPTGLTTKHLQGAFLLLAMGLVAAAAVGMVEVMVGRMKMGGDRRRTKRTVWAKKQLYNRGKGNVKLGRRSHSENCNHSRCKLSIDYETIY